MKTLHDGLVYTFGYINHRSSYDTRRVIFECIHYGTVEEYYPEPTMLFTGYDLDKRARRSFAINKIDMTTFELVRE